MQCSICNRHMIRGEKYWVCEECLERVSIQNIIGKDDYNNNALNNFPTIIAHEYYRLKELETSGETYGTFMQIKDVYEVILKFPVLIMIEGLIYSLKNEDKCESRNNILKSFIDKPLSLGDWEKIASNISKLDKEELPKNNFELYRDTSEYLGDIMRLFKIKINNESKFISSWRNDEIAHGALSFDDSNFRNEINIMIKNIHEIMKKSEKYYLNIQLVSKNGLIYKGYEKNDIKEDDEFLIKYSVNTKDDSSVLSPFVYTESYTYMFDSFNQYSNTAYRLNYSHGKKRKCYKSVDTLLEIKKILNVDELKNDFIDRENHNTIQLKKIEEILNGRVIIKPNYLNEYMMSILGYGTCEKPYAKGVFMIKAERGMGKTIFSKILDDLDYTVAKEAKPQFYDKVIKRAYHINNTYGSQLSTFKHILLNNLCSTLQTPDAIVGQIREEFSKLDFINDLESLKKQFAKILNMSFKELKEVYNKETGGNKEKFLFIIDGLDEFNYKYEQNNRTIFDFIPRPDMLDEGIFILLTSRVNDELKNSERLKLEIERIELTEPAKIVTRKNSQEYISLLCNHINRNLKISDKKEQEKLLESLDYRFSYLSAYEKLYCSKLFNKNEINTKNIIKSYLNHLKNTNKRHYYNIKRLLLILAITPIGIRMDELCYLMNESNINYRLLGTIADISNFIECKRECGVTVMSISHQEWKDDLIKNYNDDIKVLIEEYKNEFISFGNTLLQNSESEYKIEFQKDFDKFIGQFYILINYTTISQLFNEKNQIIVPDAELRKNIKFLIDIIPKLYVGDNNQKLISLKVNFFNGIIKEINSIDNKNTADMIYLQELYNERGLAFSSLNQRKEALKDHEKCIEISMEEGILIDKINLANLYMNRGASLSDLNKLEEALEDHKKAVEIVETLDKEGNLQDRVYLAKVYINRGVTFDRLNKFQEALKDYEKAMGIMKPLYKEENKLYKMILSKLYVSLGVTLFNLERFKEALKNYNKAIKIMEKLKMNEELENLQPLGQAYMNKGNILNKLGNLNEALKEYNKSIEIIELLDKEGKISDKTVLAKAFTNRASVFFKFKNFEDGIKEYEKAIKINEHLYEQDKLWNKIPLALTYIGRGKAYFENEHSINNPELLKKSLRDHEKAIEILEELYKEGILRDKKELAKAYTNKGKALNDLKCFDDSRKEYLKAIEILEELKKEGNTIEEEYLQDLYIHILIAVHNYHNPNNHKLNKN